MPPLLLLVSDTITQGNNLIKASGVWVNAKLIKLSSYASYLI